uniref:Uncharacterized protein n=1 Tax=Panagrellus redivivus TaxID=6233 RepID=A0A7E4UW23_PANRE
MTPTNPTPSSSSSNPPTEDHLPCDPSATSVCTASPPPSSSTASMPWHKFSSRGDDYHLVCGMRPIGFWHRRRGLTIRITAVDVVEDGSVSLLPVCALLSLVPYPCASFCHDC